MWQQSESFNPPLLGQRCVWKRYPSATDEANGQILDRFVGPEGYRLIVMDDRSGQLYELVPACVRISLI